MHTAAVPATEYSLDIRSARIAALEDCTTLVAPDTPARAVQLLHAAAERSCVVLDTLRRGVDATSGFDVGGV